jgi:hypothetical protein
MLSTQEIYNFLITAENVPMPPELPPIPDAGIAAPAAPAQTDEQRIEALRVRLQALIGPAVKKASDFSESTVFGDKPGEIDPEAEPLDPEWEEILEQMTAGEEQVDIPTVSHRPKKSM